MTVTQLKPSDLGLPFEEFRPEQIDAIDYLCETSPISVLEAPTGIGKTLIALGYLRLTNQRGVICTATKTLQDQYVAQSGGVAKAIYGRGNYPCVLRENDAAKAAFYGVDGSTTAANAPCVKDNFSCRFRDVCPYFVAKREAQNAQVAVMNYSYFLEEEDHAGGFKDFPVLICDEAHLLDGVLSEHFTVPISRIDYSNGLRTPVIEDKNDQAKYDKAGGRKVDWVEHSSYNTVTSKATTYYAPLIPTFEPYLRSKTIFMSATVLGAENLLRCIGLTSLPHTYKELPYLFSPRFRPIYIRPVATVNYHTSVKAAASIASAIGYIIKAHPGEKGLIHSNSYALQDMIEAKMSARVKAQVLVQHKGDSRASVLKAFRGDTRPVWLMSPSITHGEDFPNDMARCQIICKIPFPEESFLLGRRRWNMSDYGSIITARSFIQICGRIVRSERDYGETWVLDDNFQMIRGLLPKGIIDALVEGA